MIGLTFQRNCVSVQGRSLSHVWRLDPLRKSGMLYTRPQKNRRSGDFSEVDAYSGVEASDDRKRKVGEIKVSFEFRDIDLSNPGQHATFLDRPLLCAGAISRANNRKKIGELKVQVLEGRHLLSCDINGLSDPYATIRLGHQERWTETVYENLNPTWRRGTFTLEVSEIMDSLWIELWDEDRYSHDNRIGVVALPLVQLLRSGPSVLWYQVYPAPTDKRPMRLVERAEKPAKTLGYVRISTSFTIAAPLPVCMSAPPPLYPVVRTASIDEVSVRALTKFIADVVRNVERLERCVAPLFNSYENVSCGVVALARTRVVIGLASCIVDVLYLSILMVNRYMSRMEAPSVMFCAYSLVHYHYLSLRHS
eukprot:Rmarinus@m.4083